MVPAGKRKRGQPRKKGDKLPKPRDLVQEPQRVWQRQKVVLYGEEVELEVATFVGLWYRVVKAQRLRYVLVRKVEKVESANQKTKRKAKPQPWICLFSTQVELPLNTLLLAFGGRWSIEVAFAQARQHRGQATQGSGRAAGALTVGWAAALSGGPVAAACSQVLGCDTRHAHCLCAPPSGIVESRQKRSRLLRAFCDS